jgi:SnoaL-like domain
MTGIGQENLETVMIDFFGALRRGNFDDAAALLDPDVTWQGLRDDWVCHGREEVIETFRWGLDKRRDVDALEFTRAGGQVVLGVRGPSISEVDGEPLEGKSSTSSPCATARSFASPTTETGAKRSPRPASQRARTGADRRRQLKSQCATEYEQLQTSGYGDR